MTEDDVPVLTEVVGEEATAPRGVDPIPAEALAQELERAVLERLAPEVDRMIARALEEVNADLRIRLTAIVREAVAQALTPSPTSE